MASEKPNNPNQPSEDSLRQVPTLGALSISPELFEQLYLSPKNAVKGQLRNTFGNPSPIGIIGFLLGATPLSMVLMEWRGSGGLAAPANVGTYFFIAGLLLLLAAIGEWILGNTFPATIFIVFGGFWLALGATLVPNFNAFGAYAKGEIAKEGLQEPEFYASFAFFLVAMAVVCAVFTICSIRTNACFFTLLFLLVPCFSCLSASFFAVAEGRAEAASKLQHVGGGLLFALSCIGWYIFMSMLLLSVEFPFILPLGDLSTIVPGKSPRDVEKAD